MKNILKFLLWVGKLKNIKRKGISFYGVKNPDSVVDHSFRMALMVWFFGKEKRINIKKAIKIALIHDICKVLVGDITPYDGLLPKDKKEREKFVRKWISLPLRKKEKRFFSKFKKEYRALNKLIRNLPPKLKEEVNCLWPDYQQIKTPEARLVFQIDIVENLLEALEAFKKDKKFPTLP